MPARRTTFFMLHQSVQWIDNKVITTPGYNINTSPASHMHSRISVSPYWVSLKDVTHCTFPINLWWHLSPITVLWFVELRLILAKIITTYPIAKYRKLMCGRKKTSSHMILTSIVPYYKLWRHVWVYFSIYVNKFTETHKEGHAYLAIRGSEIYKTVTVSSYFLFNFMLSEVIWL